MGVVLLTLVALITDYTVVLLIKDGIMAGKFSYQVGSTLNKAHLDDITLQKLSL